MSTHVWLKRVSPYVFDIQGERNFHVLYEVVAGSAGTALGDKLKVIHMSVGGEARGVACPHPMELADKLYQQNSGVSLLGGWLVFFTTVKSNIHTSFSSTHRTLSLITLPTPWSPAATKVTCKVGDTRVYPPRSTCDVLCSMSPRLRWTPDGSLVSSMFPLSAA